LEKSLLIRFKELTGYKTSEIGERFGFSRQYAHLLIVKDYSPTSKTSAAFYLTTIIDEKISEHKTKIAELEILKQEIQKSALEKAAS
jgi:hypothetical protein